LENDTVPDGIAVSSQDSRHAMNSPDGINTKRYSIEFIACFIYLYQDPGAPAELLL
jgi:hypothetical protein